MIFRSVTQAAVWLTAAALFVVFVLGFKEQWTGEHTAPIPQPTPTGVFINK